MPLKISPITQGGGPIEIPTPTVVCENCQTAGPANRMINFKLFIGSPGHETLPPLDCNANQGPQAYGHWVCGKESCFDAVVEACKNQHLKVMLDQQHTAVTDGSSVWKRGA